MAELSSEAEAVTVWLAARRDHDGNYDVLRMPGGDRYAWDLSESGADEVIAAVQRAQLKIHGQSYWKFSYRKGERRAFMEMRSIRI